MNPAEYMQFGNILRGQYTAQQQAILNQQRQQQINDMLANDALKRRLIQEQVTGGGMGISALSGAFPNTPPASPAPPVASPVAPAPAPGQNSAQQPSPVAVPSAVPMPGATMQQAPLPPAAPVPTSRFQIAPGLQQERDKEAVRLMQQELVKQQSALPTAPPSQVPLIQGNIAALKRQIAAMSAKAGDASTAGAAPGEGASPLTVPVGSKASSMEYGSTRGPNAEQEGLIGKSLALAQSNMPVNLMAKFVQNFKRMYPNATPEQLYYAAQQANPTLTNQANSAARVAGMGIDSLFKGLTTWADMQNAQTRAALLPSQIRKNEAETRFFGTKSSAMGGGGPIGSSPVAPLQYMLTGQTPPIGSYQRYPFENEVQQLASQFQIAPGSIPAVQSTYKTSQSAQANLQKNYSQFQTSATTLHQTYSQVQQLAKQLQLDGIAKVNQGRLSIDRNLAPAGSQQANLVAQYDTLLNEMKRDYGVVSAFGKMTGYGFKSASDVFDPNRGVALGGVNQAIQFATGQGENAFQTTLSNLQNAPQIKMIDLAQNKEAAANAVGFQLGAPGLVQQYAKKYNVSDQEARAQLLAQRIYVGQ